MQAKIGLTPQAALQFAEYLMALTNTMAPDEEVTLDQALRDSGAPWSVIIE